jgi:hypothetical protein
MLYVLFSILSGAIGIGMAMSLPSVALAELHDLVSERLEPGIRIREMEMDVEHIN